MNLLRRFWRRGGGDPQHVQREVLRLTIKAARRCAHDLEHAASDVLLSRDRREASNEWHARARMWQSIFYPDGGPKDYRDDLHREIANLEGRVERLRDLCIQHGVDPDDGEDLPF